MHGCNDTRMAAGRRGDDQAAADRQAEREDRSRSVVACGEQHDHRMATAAQPAAEPAQDPEAAPGLDDLRTAGGQSGEQQGCSYRTSQVASLGEGESAEAVSLRPKGRAPVVTGPVSTSNVLAMLERQQYRCALTRRELTPETAALDHIVPLRFGGQHVIENTQVLHKDVNRAKNSMTNDDFVQLCEEVILTWRRRRSEP